MEKILILILFIYSVVITFKFWSIKTFLQGWARNLTENGFETPKREEIEKTIISQVKKD